MNFCILLIGPDFRRLKVIFHAALRRIIGRLKFDRDYTFLFPTFPHLQEWIVSDHVTLQEWIVSDHVTWNDLAVWPRDLEWPSCRFICRNNRVYRWCDLIGPAFAWTIPISCTETVFYLLVYNLEPVSHLPLCVAEAERWQLTCDSCCLGYCVMGRLAVICAWTTPDSLFIPHLWSPPLTLVTGGWLYPLLHPRDVPELSRRASL